MDIVIRRANADGTFTSMVKLKTDIEAATTKNFQVLTIDNTGAATAGGQYPSALRFRILTYKIDDIATIIQAAHTLLFGGATDHGFIATVQDENSVKSTIINTKTT